MGLFLYDTPLEVTIRWFDPVGSLLDEAVEEVDAVDKAVAGDPPTLVLVDVVVFC